MNDDVLSIFFSRSHLQYTSQCLALCPAILLVAATVTLSCIVFTTDIESSPAQYFGDQLKMYMKTTKKTALNGVTLVSSNLTAVDILLSLTSPVHFSMLSSLSCNPSCRCNNDPFLYCLYY
ncbi:hypothetical protein PsorP6_005415 [Peronosclerospora sorghi]|uniref:Uncharacterized protein n=1 Tax=Peronosclerospora sorghi TaxID=230839 RepID=A0ACC0W1D7_9STRA|nr:hypothetical protein PsorP6_005415 [Peronosclerospora sorghi]